jgi:hypothetical protein
MSQQKRASSGYHYQIKGVDRENGENMRSQGHKATNEDLTEFRRLPQVRPSQKVTLEKTYQLDAAYVQMYGWKPPTPCLACVQG